MRDRIRSPFTLTIGHTIEAEENENGTWTATIGKDVKVTGADQDEALNRAKAEYLRQAAANIEKTGKL